MIPALIRLLDSSLAIAGLARARVLADERLRLAGANACVGAQIERIATLHDDFTEAEGEIAALTSERDELAERLQLANDRLARIRRDIAASDTAAASRWTPELVDRLRLFLTEDPAGVCLVADYRALASSAWQRAASCAHGTESRHLGYAQGVQYAAGLLPHFPELLVADSASASGTDDETASTALND